MANTSIPDACPSCAAKTPPDSQFCPQCGTRLLVGETLEMNHDPIFPNATLPPRPAPAESPAAVHQVYRRPFDVHPVPLLGGLGTLALLVVVVLLAAGSLVAGLILLGIAIALLTLSFGGVKRDPDAPAARLVLRGANRLRSLAGLVAVTAGAWARAGRDLLRIRRRQQQLRSELKASLAPLGEAVHHDDQPRAQALKQQAAEIEQQLGDAESEAAAVVAAARHEIEGERAMIEPTQALSPAQTEDIHDETIRAAGPDSKRPDETERPSARRLDPAEDQRPRTLDAAQRPRTRDT